MFFSKKETARPDIDPQHLPCHIAIIMDGNGRWAKKRGLPRNAGHAAGSETLRRISTYARELGVRYLSVYAFSTENWKRSQEEVGGIMSLLRSYLLEALRDMEKNKIRIAIWGDLSTFEPELQKLCRDAEERSQIYDQCQLNICLNYGGRDEILRAAKVCAQDCLDGKMSPQELSEEDFSARLYSAGVPDPDLIIRPSGEQRLSNFLLWQAAYAEFYYTDVLWPDFKERDLLDAILAYGARKRRFGGV